MSQRWEMDDVDQKYWNDFFWDSIKDKRQFPGLNLFRDFSVTENARTQIRMGNWKLDKEKSLLILNFPGKGRREYTIHELSIAHLNVYLQKGQQQVLIKFLADGLERKTPRMIRFIRPITVGEFARPVPKPKIKYANALKTSFIFSHYSISIVTSGTSQMFPIAACPVASIGLMAPSACRTCWNWTNAGSIVSIQNRKPGKDMR